MNANYKPRDRAGRFEQKHNEDTVALEAIVSMPPPMSRDEAARLAKSPQALERKKAALFTDEASILRSLSCDVSEQVRHAVAVNPHTSIELLIMLCDDPNDDVSSDARLTHTNEISGSPEAQHFRIRSWAAACMFYKLLATPRPDRRSFAASESV